LNKKQGIGASLAAIAIAIAGGSYALTFDFSSTTETNISGDTNIGDTITNLDIDIGDLKEICASGIVPEKYMAACDVLELIP